MKRAQATNREIGLASLILLVLAVYIYFNAPQLPNPNPFKESCVFAGNLSCHSLFLRRGSGNLELALAQNTGATINVTSLVCTKKKEIPLMKPLNNTVIITSGEQAYIAGGNSGNNVICTGADGNTTPTASLGDIYEGNLYITYVEVKTGEYKFANGTLLTKYA